MIPFNLFQQIPENLDQEIFETLVDKPVKIERIISKGHSSPETGWYDQESNEWVCLLQGEAIVLFESGEKLLLKPGDSITILKHVRHKVDWTHPDIESIWIAVHY